MKKAIFFFAFFLTIGIASADAQCSSASAVKSCCAGKAAKAASSDASIEKRQSDDGSIAYVRKEADTQGNVQFVSVKYDEASNAFVNAAPKMATAASTEGMVKKSCSAAGEKKAGCASGAATGKSCCAKPAGTAATEKKAEQ